MATKRNDDPNHTNAVDEINETSWKPWKKFSFRFFFLFFGLNSHLSWFAIIFIYNLAFNKDTSYVSRLYKPLTRVCYWLDKHIYHTGYNPKIHSVYPGDGHFGLTLYITVLLLSVIGAIVWTIAQTKKTNYNRLFYWFCLYLRYLLAITILGYGFDKLIPVQMTHPSIATMLEPYGYQSKFSVLWNFMGTSPGYQIFSGACEVIAGLLLLSRRTAIAGYVLITGVLLNVAAMNIFYNVTVKMFSTYLLFVALFLLAPYVNNISRFFFRNDATPFSQKYFAFHTRWKKSLLTAILIVVPLVLMLVTVTGIVRRYHRNEVAALKEKAYDVTAFTAKDSLPPITADSSRWKRVVMNVDGEHTIIFWMDGDQDYYDCDVDSVKKTFTLYQKRNKSVRETFHYTNPSKDELQLTGNWEGRAIQVSLKLFPMKRMYLNHDTIRLIHDY
jgi:hypothetical protein